jgi:hypothetical protein
MEKAERVKKIGRFLRPDTRLVSILGSIVAHADEATSEDGHQLDVLAIRGLCRNPEIQEWLALGRELAMLPLPRKS